ncbi:pyrroloquinoline quinone biosynthesis peptide chaperone PqqD [Salinisphaera sp. Q1T1-3]|uniref:pyrroloquinoline quinone biosynthesis peptide chaperone PqqD n=1 Tax=Salinisphaera sp. Q1T1-3 TaxID=2321229 RepID=UPI000E72DC84|nr:pyrroloquinoline quinone biosynthesis peptide chaperone PqqD [Salinisphaera sp. Q1T1-3]RJS91664.1 pyrroloquinoline quinone biosynthesis peptide chaperone PqqD [Salinisphaera sp. Q1T1-3]
MTTETPIHADAVPQLARGYRLQFEPAQDCHVLLYPEGMITLNEPAAEILKRCDGERSVAGLCEALRVEFGDVDLAADVRAFLELARSHGWVRLVA